MRIAGLNMGHVMTGGDESVRQRHLRFILSLAEESHCEVQDIAPLYEEVLASFSGAKVEDYVPIFVCRHVKRIISGRRVYSR